MLDEPVAPEVEERWGPQSEMFDPGLLAGFRPRHTDVLLCTAPKSGTTLMQNLLHQLRTGGDDTFDSINEVVPWLELPERDRTSRAAQLAAYEALPDPRVFKTHLPADRAPGAEVSRVVCLARDPRDCCVSHFHHLRGLTDEMRSWLGAQAPDDLGAFVDAYVERSDWYSVVESWWPRRDAPNVLWLRYADLNADKRREAERVARFCGWDAVGVDAAVELTSLEHMRRHEGRFSRLFRGRPPSFRPASFVRRGEVRRGRGALTDAQSAAILERAREVLDDEGWRWFGLG